MLFQVQQTYWTVLFFLHFFTRIQKIETFVIIHNGRQKHGNLSDLWSKWSHSEDMVGGG